jgi:hypothetical protein
MGRPFGARTQSFISHPYQIQSEKECARCKITLPISKFRSDNYTSVNGEKKTCYRSNCDKCAALIQNIHLSKNPRNYLSQVYRSAKCRSKKNNIPFDLSLDEWCEIYHNQNGLCALSGLKMTHQRQTEGVIRRAISGESNHRFLYNISPDQIEPSKGYTRGNLQFVCTMINTMKMSMSTNLFLDFCKLVYLKSASAV